MICSPSIVVLSSFGRETSLVNIMGPRSIFPPLFTPLLFTAFVSFPLQSPLFFPLHLILCKEQDQRDWQPLWTRWEQSYLLLCAGPRQPRTIRQTSGAVDTYLYLSESYGRQTLVSLPRETCCWLLLNLPLGVANEEHYFSAIKQISGAVAGDSTLQDRRVAHYLLPLLFSLVSLLCSFCFWVLYEKPKK